MSVLPAKEQRPQMLLPPPLTPSISITRILANVCCCPCTCGTKPNTVIPEGHRYGSLCVTFVWNYGDKSPEPCCLSFLSDWFLLLTPWRNFPLRLWIPHPCHGEECLEDLLNPAAPAITEHGGAVLSFAEVQDNTDVWPGRARADPQLLLTGTAQCTLPVHLAAVLAQESYLPSELRSVTRTPGTWLSYFTHPARGHPPDGATCQHWPSTILQ